MAGGDIVDPKLLGAVEKLAEFQVAVAVDAGIGCAALLVNLREFSHHHLIEGGRKIKLLQIGEA